jgi:hypothetical protein
MAPDSVLAIRHAALGAPRRPHAVGSLFGGRALTRGRFSSAFDSGYGDTPGGATAPSAAGGSGGGAEGAGGGAPESGMAPGSGVELGTPGSGSADEAGAASPGEGVDDGRGSRRVSSEKQ